MESVGRPKRVLPETRGPVWRGTSATVGLKPANGSNNRRGTMGCHHPWERRPGHESVRADREAIGRSAAVDGTAASRTTVREEDGIAGASHRCGG